MGPGLEDQEAEAEVAVVGSSRHSRYQYPGTGGLGGLGGNGSRKYDFADEINDIIPRRGFVVGGIDVLRVLASSK